MKALFIKPIVIHLYPSLLLLGLLFAVATLSSVVLFTLPIGLAFKIAFFALIVLTSAYYMARDAMLILPWSWKSIIVDTKGMLTIINNRNHRFKRHLEVSSFVHEQCVILNVQNEGFSFSLHSVLLFNNVDNPEALRRLRVWLRLYKNKRAKETYPQLDEQPTTQIST